MKLGIIGAGLIVHEFLPILKTLENLDILGIQGVPEEIEKVQELCHQHDISTATSSFEELIATGIDTVYVAVPNYLHYSYVKKSLEAGLHVIVEKPMTSNISEAEKLAELAQEKKLFLFEAITTRYMPSYQKIREWLPEIGDIKLVSSDYSQYSSRYDKFKDGKIQPVFDLSKAGGALMDLNLYNLHFIIGLFGQPKDVHYYANLEKEIDTSGLAVLSYPDFVATAAAAKDSNGRVGAMIQGTKGYITTTSSPNLVGEVNLYLNDGRTRKFDDHQAQQRAVPEFKTFMTLIETNDLETCYNYLNDSLWVSQVQTELRQKAGIIFPMDEVNHA